MRAFERVALRSTEEDDTTQKKHVLRARIARTHTTKIELAHRVFACKTGARAFRALAFSQYTHTDRHCNAAAFSNAGIAVYEK